MLKQLRNFRKLNAIAVSEKLADALPLNIPKDGIRRRMMDVLLNIGIPFNRWLGLKIKEFSLSKVVIESPATTLRQNHVGSAHACALALIGEYAAGLLIAQNFSFDDHRLIIGRLEIEYKKQGRGLLHGTANAPESWPVLVDGETWVPMTTVITDASGNEVAICKTNWQVKNWKMVKSVKA